MLCYFDVRVVAQYIAIKRLLQTWSTCLKTTATSSGIRDSAFVSDKAALEAVIEKQGRRTEVLQVDRITVREVSGRDGRGRIACQRRQTG